MGFFVNVVPFSISLFGRSGDSDCISRHREKRAASGSKFIIIFSYGALNIKEGDIRLCYFVDMTEERKEDIFVFLKFGQSFQLLRDV